MLRYLTPLLIIVACADPSRGVAIDRVVPDRAEINTAQPVTIEGTFHVLTSNLDEGSTTAALVTASVDTTPLDNTIWISENEVTAMMPALAEGVYDVSVSLDGRSATLKDAYIVGNPPLDGGGSSFASTHLIRVVGTVVNGPHVDFPLLLDVTDGRFATIANGGEVANAAGFDIFFSSDPAGQMRLSHEIESYTAATGDLVAWVKIPSLLQGTTFYIHMGDPSVTSSLENVPDVWSNGYAAVWHLTDATDSTGINPGIATNTGSDPAGQIEAATSFDGSSSSISIGSSATIDNIFDGGGTIEGWFFATSAGESNFGRIFEKGPGFGGHALAMCDGQGVPRSMLFVQAFSLQTINWCTNADVITLNAWFHVAVVYDDNSTANRPSLFINGSPITLNGGQPSGTRVSDAGDPLFIGDRQAGARAFAGSIDEARFSRAARTSGWIATTFENQSLADTYVMIEP